MNEKTDLELIELIRKGDELAFEILYDRYSGSAMGFVYKIMRNEELAAEIVQETFIRVWDHCERYDASKGKFATWMFGIARNLAIDKYRKLKIRPEAAENESEVRQMEFAPSAHDRVEETVAGRIRRETVKTVMQELPDNQREIIELSFFQGMTRREIASKTGIALGTVNSRARLAMIKLGSLLEHELQGAIKA